MNWKKQIKKIKNLADFRDFEDVVKDNNGKIIMKSNGSNIKKVDTHIHNNRKCVLVNEYDNPIAVKWNQLFKTIEVIEGE